MVGADHHTSSAGVYRKSPDISLSIFSVGEPQETLAFGVLLSYRHPEPMIAPGIEGI